MAFDAFFERCDKAMLAFFVDEGRENPRSDVTGNLVDEGEILHKGRICRMDLDDVIMVVLFDGHPLMTSNAGELNGDRNPFRYLGFFAGFCLFFLGGHGNSQIG